MTKTSAPRKQSSGFIFQLCHSLIINLGMMLKALKSPIPHSKLGIVEIPLPRVAVRNNTCKSLDFNNNMALRIGPISHLHITYYAHDTKGSQRKTEVPTFNETYMYIRVFWRIQRELILSFHSYCRSWNFCWALKDGLDVHRWWELRYILLSRGTT